ncbi:50S ribosomal protein L2 [Candidatus Pacearchaeota archaeon]|nr:50S ribosomal protein L2P [uncultured archaeon]MBS3099947.1 50S ribosomal protein L2 [Candidatus Pacearchaeota archaeon]
MGKRIVSQARGHGSMTYRVRRKAFIYRIGYPNYSGEATILKLINSAGHSAPISKIKAGNIIFYNLASEKVYQGQKINIGAGIEHGDIAKLKDIPAKTNIFNIESRPGDGGKFIRTAGGYATIIKKEQGNATLLLPSKQEKVFNDDCRATIGVIAGSGRNIKPVVKAGKQFYIKRAKGKLWPRTSAVKMNVIDHPFGSGRGKNLTHGNLGKIPKRNAPPGAKVGSVRARKTGRKKSKR